MSVNKWFEINICSFYVQEIVTIYIYIDLIYNCLSEWQKVDVLEEICLIIVFYRIKEIQYVGLEKVFEL